MKKLLFTLMLLFLLPISTFASELTLEGFNGIKFGSSINSVKDKMKLIPDKENPDNPLKYYELKEDALKINGIKVSYIMYMYDNGKFVGIVATTNKPKNIEKIQTYLIDHYGQPIKVSNIDALYKPKKATPEKFETINIWQNKDFFIKTINRTTIKRSGRIPIPTFFYILFFERNLATLETIEVETI